MSDHWETYPCQMGELPAFITYDHGVAAELEALPFPNLVGFRIPLDQPDERGLPCGDDGDSRTFGEHRDDHHSWFPNAARNSVRLWGTAVWGSPRPSNSSETQPR